MKKSPCFKRLLAYAAFDCAQRGKHLISPDHLLLALYREDFPLIDDLMSSFQIDSFYPFNLLLRKNPESQEPKDVKQVRIGNDAMEVIGKAGVEVQRFQHNFLTCAHVLMALVNSDGNFLHDFLSQKKIEPLLAKAKLSEICFSGDLPMETVEIKRDKSTYLAVDFVDTDGYLPEHLGISTMRLMREL